MNPVFIRLSANFKPGLLPGSNRSPVFKKIVLNITAPQLIELIKSSIEFDGADVNITMDNLIGLNHSANPDHLVNLLLDLKDVSMNDNGFIIPKSYFE